VEPHAAGEVPSRPTYVASATLRPQGKEKPPRSDHEETDDRRNGVVSGLEDAEIVRIVNRCIGVSGGYLGPPERFSNRTHSDFYAEYCDLSVHLSPFEGTTR
jgi:hypothetical protein